ncbi:type II toxin-antitoxin system mRNA interferase toxin, RelE/StbE family [Planosporangium thailandense]|uniref:Type II toxin-antitoxin system mRNA interferase toxin, RelE/StbE family n=1 Tax=Planosporangium thailandense TaxID=765197 RepID=A0ABX0XZI8_9ACTN|nr:type II toxin-antitoxin system mRNA interferase toxin, RelE/StbE family [Planosporangium thailandense]NJC71481.1 type II toxin-antitoxin system mRNA interferase toxin, RelE/StbE family [Planosporangium thailandense]
MAEINFTEAAIDDLRRIGPDAVPKVLKKVLLLEDNPEAGYPLGGELTGFRKLVVGRNTWRIVYRITDDKSVEICEVWAVGARADAEVYAEAAARIRAAGATRPDLVKLARVVEQLGRRAGGVIAAEVTPREPVPDWLADRLIFTVGMPREEVAALDLQQAVDLWAAFISKPN